MLLFNVFSNFIIHFLLYFNTSNVTIQLYTIPVCRYLWRISIHLMLLFNQNLEPFIELIRNISIHLMLLFNKPVYAAISYLGHFNTSNVTIQHKQHHTIYFEFHHFNTSNVTIQQNCTSTNRSKKEISIHLMLLFNKIALLLTEARKRFQYI